MPSPKDGNRVLHRHLVHGTAVMILGLPTSRDQQDYKYTWGTACSQKRSTYRWPHTWDQLILNMDCQWKAILRSRIIRCFRRNQRSTQVIADYATEVITQVGRSDRIYVCKYLGMLRLISLGAAQSQLCLGGRNLDYCALLHSMSAQNDFQSHYQSRGRSAITTNIWVIAFKNNYLTNKTYRMSWFHCPCHVCWLTSSESCPLRFI